MGNITLFTSTSPYKEDVTKNDKLTPAELDANFISLKNGDISSMSLDTESNKLSIVLNDGNEFSVILPKSEATAEKANGVVDFKSINNDIVLTTDDEVYSIDINTMPIIAKIGDISTVVGGNYNPENGVLTLQKDGGEIITIDGFINYLTDGILSDAYLSGNTLVLKVKNGGSFNVDLSPLIADINISTVNFSNKTVRVNKLVSTDSSDTIKINEHLLISKNMTTETKNMGVGKNQMNGTNSLSVGVNNTINSDNSLVVGENNQTDCNDTFIQGDGNIINENGRASSVVGRNIAMKGGSSFASGSDHIIESNVKNGFVANTGNTLSGESGFVGGKNNKGSGKGSYTVGNSNVNAGEFAFVEGGFNKITDVGKYAHAEGHDNIVMGEGAHAEGCRNTVSGDSAHAEGHDNIVAQQCAHVEGENNKVEGLASHAGGSTNSIGLKGDYGFVHGVNNLLNAKMSVIFGNDNKIDSTTSGCLENVYVIGRNINGTVKDTLYVNKLNINSAETALNIKPFILQMDKDGYTYKTKFSDILEYLNDDFAMITDGVFVNYGDDSDDNKIVLTGDVEGYEVVIDKIENTYVTSGQYDPYTKQIILKNNAGEDVIIPMDKFAPPVIEIRVHTNNTLLGDGTTINPLKINPLHETGDLKPVIDMVDTLPLNPIVGDRYVITEDVINAGYLYKHDDVATFNVDGWRLPSKEDWDLLLNKIDSVKTHEEMTSGWKGETAGTLLKNINYGGTDLFNFGIVAANYITDEGPVTNMQVKYWTSKQVHEKYDIYTKRFKADTGKVYNEPVSGGDESQISVRLVKEYDSKESAPTQTTINGVTYPVLLMPDGKLWLGANLCDNTITHSTPDNTTPATISSILIAEWDGSQWLKGVIGDGYSIIVKNKNYGEYTMENGVLVPFDFDPTEINERLDVLEAGLAQEIVDRGAADTNLQNNINIETTARQTADTALQTNIDAEATDREAADTTLQSNINAEATARESADTNLQTQIDDLSSDASDLNIKVDQEIADRQAGDVVLQDNINTEAVARQAADTQLQTNIDTEESNRETADTNLQNNINIETTARQAADTQLQANIDTEETNRETADTTLQGNIDAEEAARQNADNVLQGNITQEIADRVSADTNLQNQIDDLSGDAGDLSAKVDQEIADRVAGDANLQNNINVEASARIAADNVLQTNITAEETARQNADTALQGNIDAEASARVSGDNNLQTQLNTETTARQAADTQLQTNITAEETARQNADTALQTSIASVNTDLQNKNIVAINLDWTGGVITLVKGDTTQNVTKTFTTDYGTF